VTSSNSVRTIKTAKFSLERRLRVYAKIIIALSGFLPRIGCFPQGHAAREIANIIPKINTANSPRRFCLVGKPNP
jgi:hypothetical protein